MSLQFLHMTSMTRDPNMLSRHAQNLFWWPENEIRQNEILITLEMCITVMKQFQIDWSKPFSDIDTNPGLRTYVDLKTNFTIAPYLCLVDDFKFRNAISKLRSSSHKLEIERGRHTRPRTPITDRLCPKCEVLEDEAHFLTSCDLFTTERDILFSRITTMFSDFQTLANHETFISMLCYPDRELLTIVGKFIYNCFQVVYIYMYVVYIYMCVHV